MRDAVIEAKVFVRQAIEHAQPIGKGTGPVNPLYRLGKEVRETAHPEETARHN
jgi:hypothetical protein